MKLTKELTRVFEEEVERVFKLEQEKEQFLAQESFETCEARAKAGLESAFKRVTNFLTTSIIEHRESEHGENYAFERSIVQSQMSEADVKATKQSVWWQA